MRVQRNKKQGEEQFQGAQPLIESTIASGGQPLDPQVRSTLEPRFGHDFSNVQVHTDASAARSAEAVEAHAYTVGSHIAFNAGQYDPQSAGGQQLIAHELAHVVQQSSGAASSPMASSMVVSEPGDRHEQEAEAAAEAVLAGGQAELSAGAAEVQREADEDDDDEEHQSAGGETDAVEAEDEDEDDHG
jgi:hypothetical protein